MMTSAKKNLFSVFICILFFSFLSGCSTSNSTFLSGTLETTELDVSSEISGKVQNVFFMEGSEIKKGEIIATVDSSAQELMVEQQEALLSLKKAKLAEIKAGSRAEQLTQAQANLDAAKAKLEAVQLGARKEQISQLTSSYNAAHSNTNNAKITYLYWKDKYETLINSNSTSNDLNDLKLKRDTSFELYKAAQNIESQARAQLDLIKAGATKQDIIQAQAVYKQAKAQLDLLNAGATNYTISQAQSDYDQVLASLNMSKLVLEKYKMKAPIDGIINTLAVDIGSFITTGTSIGSVIKTGNLWVNLYIPQKHLQKIHINQSLTLSSPALEKKSIKGKVVYVSEKAEFTPKNTETEESRENTVFKFKVLILDNLNVLKPGMTVDVAID